MRVVENSLEMALACREVPRPLGLVPTMGALHEGHLALVRRGRQENSTLAASIFVNPAQFSASDDLAAYPRDLTRDIEMLREEQVDLTFVPGVEDMYPTGFDTWVNVGDLADKLEGAHRPGHFRGVATVVTRLFNLVRPDRAYFGQKDGQQTVVIRRLVHDLAMGIEIVAVPTVREVDGLALSSRNVYLTPPQRQAAPVIYRALCLAEELWRHGVREAELLRQSVRDVLDGESQIGSIYYVSVADVESLDELETVTGRAMVSTAVQMGHTRLIDNIILG